MAQPSEISTDRPDTLPSIAAWLEALGHESPFEARPGSSPGGPETTPLAMAVQGLLAALRGPDPSSRLRAATALGNFGAEAHWALTVLRGALKEAALRDGDEAVRAAAAQAVLQAGPRPASPVAELAASLQDDLDLVRFHAAIALGDMGPEARPAVAALTHASLWDPVPAIRVESAAALWKIDRKGPLVLPALIKALEDESEMVRWVAAECLGQIGPEAAEAVPALRAALRKPFRLGLVRKGVALALQQIDPQAAAEAEVV